MVAEDFFFYFYNFKSFYLSQNMSFSCYLKKLYGAVAGAGTGAKAGAESRICVSDQQLLIHIP
jgi:hypothetical protein